MTPMMSGGRFFFNFFFFSERPSDEQIQLAGDRLLVAVMWKAVQDSVKYYNWCLSELRKLNVGNRLLPDEEDETRRPW